MNDAVEDVISKVTGRQRELIKKDFRRDFYLNAEEAAEYGIIDKVLYPSSEGTDVGEVRLGEFATTGGAGFGDDWKN
ncbi:hypothetical protein TrCOL_g7144 [Triparma columacea]|nr:hypothetical protein TrCOL_g7144 [Triparma columacea]